MISLVVQQELCGYWFLNAAYISNKYDAHSQLSESNGCAGHILGGGRCSKPGSRYRADPLPLGNPQPSKWIPTEAWDAMDMHLILQVQQELQACT